MTKPIKVGSVYFVANKRQVTDSLFNEGGTANGVYKKLKGRTHFYNMQGELFAAIVKNEPELPFFVTARKHEGKTRYMFSLTDQDQVTLGLEKYGFLKEYEEARRVWSELYEENIDGGNNA